LSDLSNEELAIKIKESDPSLVHDYINILWNRVEKFVRLQVYKFYTKNIDRCAAIGITEDDLYQECYLTIYKAVEQYDLAKGFKFLTHMGYYIKNCLRDVSKLKSATEKYFVVSLDASNPNDDEDNRTLLGLIPDPDGEKRIDDIAEQDYISKRRTDLDTAASSLSVEQANVINLRYYNDLTIAETAERLKVPDAKISHLQKKALKTLSVNPLLQEYRQYVIDQYSFGRGVGKWKETGMSPQERVLLELEKHGLL